MGAPKLHIQTAAVMLLLATHYTSSSNPTPVFETINEQARIDDNVRISSSPAILPYGNPLAGNSKRNARIHANNQQAMFNAERMRQHKAQLQRWKQGPQIIDSYMKAYHESQESHQLALEQQQATLKDNVVTNTPSSRTQGRTTRQRTVQSKRVIPSPENESTTALNGPSTPSNRVKKQRQDLPRRGSFFQRSEPTKITIADAVIKDARNRNHRSYGSTNYYQNLDPNRFKTVYVSPTPSYDQGVTIKPNGNAGLAQTQPQAKEPTNLYTVSIPSGVKYSYPKHLPTFKAVQEIHALNSLLKKNPTEQLADFNALLNSAQNSDDINKEIPIDFYFYLKDPTSKQTTHNLDNLKYTQSPNTYASAFMPKFAVKDHTPITEEVDDIEDPNKGPLGFQPVSPSTSPDMQTTTTKSNNYYKVEVASQTISTGTGIKPNQVKEEYYVKQENDPHYESFTYGYQPYYKQAIDDSKTEMYLHHNAEPTGVQHLSEDGTETSAFGDDNVSIKINKITKSSNRIKRSELETEPFLLKDEKTSTESNTAANGTDAPTSESLIRLNPLNKKRAGDFNVFLTPNFPIGEAIDYADDYDYPALRFKKPHQKYESFYEEEDYTNYDDFSSPDYDFVPPKQSFQNYAPSSPYQLESKGSFSKKVRRFRRPNLHSPTQFYGAPPATSYGVPIYGTPTTIFATPTFSHPKFELSAINTIANLQNIIEPIYMLTQSQLKELIGHHNLNIEHLDVYQLSKENKGKKIPHYPRKYRKRNPFRHVRNNLHKLHKFNA